MSFQRSMHRLTRPHTWSVFYACLIITLASLWLVQTLPTAAQTAPHSPDPQTEIAQAWENAINSGVYSYDTSVEHTEYPVPRLSNSGRQPTTQFLAIAGQVDQAQELLEMTIWQDAGRHPDRGISVKVENGQTLGRAGNGNWEEMDHFTDLFAPNQDPLGFLATTKNVKAQGADVRQLGELTVVYSHYTFELDGDAYAAHMERQIRDHLQQFGSLPPGMRLSTADIYRRATGLGDLWLDSAGLPVRLTMHLDIPAYQENGRTVSLITTDLSGFDQANIAAAQAQAEAEAAVTLWKTPQQWATLHQTSIVNSVETGTAIIALLLTLSGTVLLVVRYWRSKNLHAAISSILVFSIVVPPLFITQQAQAFSENLHSYHQEQTQQRVEATALEDAKAQLKTSDWDPHTNPLESDLIKAEAAALKEERSNAFTTLATSNDDFADSTDSDGDGLLDADEEVWGTCAYTLNSTEYNSADTCDGITDPTDTDGDTIKDGIEVNDLGSSPLASDTDEDGLADNLEIGGFEYNNQTWYPAFNDEDTNKDGIVDGLECLVWTELSDAYDPTAVCPDTDNDGTPDLFDADNDGDFVPDAQDISPNTGTNFDFDFDNPFLFRADNLEEDKVVLLDIQFRPKFDDNLNLYNHVLDWPTHDTDGQITRYLDTTWADTANSTIQSDADNAANGDIRLVPMLEITMPYSDSHYANLPISTTASADRVLGEAVDTWLDSDQLDPFSISVEDTSTTSGELAAYVPIVPVTNDYDTTVAYSGQMLYRPTQGTNGTVDWGNDHQFRIVWLVQMITDQCVNEDDDPDTCAREDVMTVIHTYYEEWALTGLSASEEHGLESAIIYEDPAQDDDLSSDDQLWTLSWNLANTLMRGRDCEIVSGDTCDANTDGERDVTVTNLDSTLDEWLASDRYLTVENHSYDHSSYMSYLVAYEATDILDTTFTPYADTTIPTLMYLHESETRSMNLDDDTFDISNGLTFDFDPAVIQTNTTAHMSWTPYDYVGGTWTSHDTESYIDILEARLELDDYFQPEDDSETAEYAAYGKTLWAVMYYSALMVGATTLIEVDSQTVFTPNIDGPLAEIDYSRITPAGSTNGATFILAAYSEVILKTIPSVKGSTDSYFTRVGKAWNKTTPLYDFTFYKQFKSGRYININTNVLTGLVLKTAIIGATLLVIGYFSGNDTVFRVGVIILSVVTIAVTTVFAINAMKAIVTAFRTAATIGQAYKMITNFQSTGPIGFLVGGLVTWGYFLYQQYVEGGLTSMQSSALLAYAIASTIILLGMLFLDYIGLGIIGMIIIIIDAILALLGKETFTEWLTEKLAKFLYDVDMVIKNLESSDRLDIQMELFDFSTPLLGFSLGNSFIFTYGVTNTLKYNERFGRNTAEDRNVFVYDLQTTAESIRYQSLARGDMTDEWLDPEEYKIQTADRLSITIPLTSIGSGLNQGVDLYMIESYFTSYEGCWLYNGLFGADGCKWDDTAGFTPINLGESLAYDILPANIQQFALMDWDDALPTQVDGDADGLPSTDGTDPNDNDADTDGDGLLDTYEVSYGLNYGLADADNDGLTDAEELNLDTNPFVSDSDGDGLNDYIETIEGWLIVYNENQVTRVYSDPNSADFDEDGLDDLDEFLFGFNPWVATDPSIIETLVEFEDLTVEENTDLQMLFRMEESATAQQFIDSSGQGISGSCDETAGRCPTAEVIGRYGDSLFFDGTDLITTDLAQDVAQFTMAAWIYNSADDTDFHAIMGYQDGDINTRAPGIWVVDQTKIHAGVSDGTWHYLTTGDILTQNRWQHVAATFDGDTYQIYVDGVNVYSDNSFTDLDPIPFANYNIGSVDNDYYFEGNIDEAAFFDKALTATEIEALMNGRYNASDLYAAPGTSLTYQATVTNSTSTNATGFLVPETGYIEPELPAVHLALSFEEDQRLVYFENSIETDNAPLVCTAAADACPTTGQDGPLGNAIAFDGVNDYLEMPGLIGRYDQSYSVLFWLYVESIPNSGETAMILDTESTADGAMDIYLNSDGKLVIDAAERSTITSNYNFGNNLNQWVHVAYNGNALYINYNENGNSLLSGEQPVTVGHGRLGNSLDGTSPFHGQLDELVVFNDNLSDGSGGSATSVDELEMVGTGDYILHNGDSSHSIEIAEAVYSFEELIDLSNAPFFNNIITGDNATCTDPACPQLTESDEGYTGRAVFFDGVDDSLTQTGSTVSSDEAEYIFYIKPLSYPAAGEVAYLYDTTAIGQDEDYSFNLYLDENGQINYDGDDTSQLFQTVIPLNEWSKIRLWYDDRGSRYEIYLSVNNVRDSWYKGVCSGTNSTCQDESQFIGSGTIGNNIAGDSPFHGYIDEVSIVIADYDFDAPSNSIGYENLANASRTASCNEFSLCASVADGKYGKGAAFDGVDDVLNLGDVFDSAPSSFTLGLWFYMDALTPNDDYILAQQDGSGTGQMWLAMTDDTSELFSYLTGSHVGLGYPAVGNWHYATITYDGTTLRHYLNGQLTNSTTSPPLFSDGDLLMGLSKNEDFPFQGTVDEMIILTEAADETQIAFLMESTYPALEIANDFERYTAGPLASVQISGEASIADNLPTSRYQFDLEVEAALELQTQIDFPVIDNNSADISVFIPFEDTPGSTYFDNLIPYEGSNDIFYNIEAQCYNDSCPTAGFRGIIGRAAHFDGLDDFIEIDIPNTINTAPGISAASMWVKGTKGTILDSRSEVVDDNAVRIDFGHIYQYEVDGDNNITSYETTFDMPLDEWTHLAFVIDDGTSTGTVYINGQAVVSGTHFVDAHSDLWTIGANFGQQNFFAGLIDDLRVYETAITAADVLTLYETSAPVLRFEFDEDDTATTFADESPNRLIGYPTVTTTFNSTLSETVTTLSPTPGTDGKIGNTALFDGNGYIEIPNSADTVDFIQDFTIMAWMKTTEAGTGIVAKTDDDATWERDEKVFFLDATGTPRFVGFGNNYIIGDTSVTDDVWHHVVVVWDRDAEEGYIYVDGSNATSNSTYWANNNDSPTDTLKIGAPNYNEVSLNFDGQLDELAIYGRALTEAEISGIYLQEYRWYRANSYNEIQVDLDPPTIDYLSDASYRTEGYIQLSVATRDTHSYINTFDFGVKGPSDSDFSWQSAPICGEALVSGAAWCPYFDTADYGGSGLYEVQFRAVDAVGNETTSEAYPIYVDGQAPTTTTSYSDQFLDATEIGTLEWTIDLSGNISDPDLGSGVAGAGVVSNTLQLGLFDTSGGLIEDGWQAVTLSGTSWTLAYRFSGERPSGVYTVKLSAEDEMGNTAVLDLGTVLLDERPPTADANLWELPSEVISQTTTLNGVSVEQPGWGDNIAAYHFETDLADFTAYDNSSNAFHATCAGTGDCPTADLSGPFGQALTFDGIDDALAIPDNEALDFGLDDDFTIAVWVSADAIQNAATVADNSIVEKWSNTGSYPFVIRYLNQSTSDAGKIQVARWNGSSGASILSTSTLNDGESHHIVFSKQGDTLYLYIDGVLDGSTADLTSGTVTNDSPIYLGRRGNNTAQFFTGTLDELYIYERALTAIEIYALAQDQVTGVNTVELLIEEQDLSSGTAVVSGTWETATITNGAWHYDMPTDTEGFYTAQLRTTDNNGNTAEEGLVWRGTIDDTGPDISSYSQQIGGGSVSKTEYQLTITDFILDVDSLDQLCESPDVTTSVYNDDALPQNGQPYQASVTCLIDGHETSRDFTVCDVVGNCTTTTISTPAFSMFGAIEIQSPAEGTNLIQGETVTITIAAYDPMMIVGIQLTADGDPIGNYSPTGGANEVSWSVAWTPNETGEIELKAFMPAANTPTDEITLSVVADPFEGVTAVTENGTDLRLSWSLSAEYCGYAIHQSDTPYFDPAAGTEIGTTDGDTNSYLVSDGTADGPWFYTIVATSCTSGTAVADEIGVFDFSLTAGD